MELDFGFIHFLTFCPNPDLERYFYFLKKRNCDFDFFTTKWYEIRKRTRTRVSSTEMEYVLNHGMESSPRINNIQAKAEHTEQVKIENTELRLRVNDLETQLHDIQLKYEETKSRERNGFDYLLLYTVVLKSDMPKSDIFFKFSRNFVYMDIYRSCRKVTHFWEFC